MEGDTEHNRQYVHDIELDKQTSTQCNADDSIQFMPFPTQQLPTEIIAKILQCLAQSSYYPRDTIYQCILVSKQFNTLAFPLLWHTYNFGDTDRDKVYYRYLVSNNNNIMARTQEHEPQRRRRDMIPRSIRRVRFHHDYWTVANIKTLLQHIPHLERLLVGEDVNVTMTQLHHLLLPYGQHLTKFDINDHRYPGYKKPTTRYVFRMGYLSEYLEYRRLALSLAPRGSSSSPYTTTTTSNGTLEYMAIVFKWKRTYDNEFQPLTSILQTWNHMTHINIACDMPVDFSKTLLLPPSPSPATATATMATHWSSLTHLTLRASVMVDDTLLIDFMKTHPHLRHLALVFDHQQQQEIQAVTDASVNAMIKWLPHLTHLTLKNASQITPQAIQRLIRHGSSTLATIKCYHCLQLTRNKMVNDWDTHDNDSDDQMTTTFTLGPMELGKIREACEQQQQQEQQ